MCFFNMTKPRKLGEKKKKARTKTAFPDPIAVRFWMWCRINHPYVLEGNKESASKLEAITSSPSALSARDHDHWVVGCGCSEMGSIASIPLVQTAAKMMWFGVWDSHQIMVTSWSLWLPNHGSGDIIAESAVFWSQRTEQQTCGLALLYSSI